MVPKEKTQDLTVGKNGKPRQKAWQPKAKTGCITCRIRRVKCDEAKPHCVRCTSTGRKCDGYTYPGRQSRPWRQMGHSPGSLPLSIAMSGLQLESAEELKAFDFFQCRSASELSGFFDAQFWQFEVLQASHYLPSIRHAVIALGAMHRKLIAGDAPVVPDDVCDSSIRFALSQSNRALQEIFKSPGYSTMEDKIHMMTTCILFHCLACIQGHQNMAFEHLRSGLRILGEVDKELDRGTADTNRHAVSLSTLRAMLVNMDVQARSILSDKMYRVWEPEPKRQVGIHHVPFLTFAQARVCFESTYTEVMGFLAQMDTRSTGTHEAVREIFQKYKRIQCQFLVGSNQLEEFLSQLSYPLSKADKNSVIGIRLIHDQVKAVLKIFRHFNSGTFTGVMNWAVEDEDMEVMLDLACQYLDAPSDLTLPSGATPKDYYTSQADRVYRSGIKATNLAPPAFSCCSGLLSALWIVTSRSRNLDLRRRAIGLFMSYPRREGLWDSIFAGRVAWEQMIMEEEALEKAATTGVQPVVGEQRGPIVMEWNKIRNISIRYPGVRTAEIEFCNVQQYEVGERGVVRQIAW
ncbi:hypothetical protein K504DRAFT_486294 [Pleomassaria siparia CBS 279.74]|uniref:Zn(2)-C6 fungal-type domain-containing protein n=1 Tax=Pleomassaria siparia CBS 279.74 TaxID=1314801 RepID=A0A6G1KPP5_9PLEO|nr:hypothetical protein K504DRAFT_486294 [Pleomassaria siparia CBS 279.74]